MIEGKWPEQEEVSLFAVGTMLLHNRRRIIRWMIVGAVAAVLTVFLTPRLYVAGASFIPQGSDPARTNLQSLAGQLGVSLPQSNQTLSPDLYGRLIKSRVLLSEVARDTFVVPEMGGRRATFYELFKIDDESPALREEAAMRVLGKIVSVAVVKTTGVVDVSTVTKWPSVSLTIVKSLVDGVNEFNQRTRQSQASAERKFVEGRLAIAASDLRSAEDRLQTFQSSNRDFRSPELNFQRDRLSRDVTLQQQVFTTLTQSLEDARIREVRDTPVITVLEPPYASPTPQSRHLLLRLLLGLAFGAFIGGMLSVLREGVTRRRQDGDPEAETFAGTLGEVKGEVLGPVRRFTARIRG